MKALMHGPLDVKYLFDLNGSGGCCVWSEDHVYRYVLQRRWGPRPDLLFIMLNPSVADHSYDDPTVKRCVGYARREGFGGILVCNLFALVSTDPKRLKRSQDAVGPRNAEAIIVSESVTDATIVAWGAQGRWRDQDTKTLATMERDVFCLGRGPSRYPRHPLYLRADQAIFPYGQETPWQRGGKAVDGPGNAV
jgi:hypothetical protein